MYVKEMWNQWNICSCTADPPGNTGAFSTDWGFMGIASEDHEFNGVLAKTMDAQKDEADLENNSNLYLLDYIVGK